MTTNGKVESFLESLEIYELAFLYTYNLDSYLEDSASKIRKYIDKKELTKDKMEALINLYRNKQFDDGKERCSRCRTDKVQLVSKNNDTNFELHCNVCGLNESFPKKSKWRQFFEFLRDFLTIGH